MRKVKLLGLVGLALALLAGGWTPNDLKIAVEQAIARAKPSSPSSPPAPS